MKKEKNTISAEKAYIRLKEGNKRFFEGNNKNQDLSINKRRLLYNGQNPFVIILGCSDSRMPLSLIFNQGLGDIFEIKLAGNIINEEAMGSLEYAIEYLNVPLIVVLGHENCGAVNSTIECCESKIDAKGNINNIVERIKLAYNLVKTSNKNIENLNEEVCEKNIEIVAECIKCNKLVKSKIDEGKVMLLKAKYLLNGEVRWLE